MITHRLEWSVIVAAMLLTSPAARASDDCLEPALEASDAGRLEEAIRLYRQALNRPACRSPEIEPLVRLSLADVLMTYRAVSPGAACDAVAELRAVVGTVDDPDLADAASKSLPEAEEACRRARPVIIEVWPAPEPTPPIVIEPIVPIGSTGPDPSPGDGERAPGDDSTPAPADAGSGAATAPGAGVARPVDDRVERPVTPAVRDEAPRRLNFGARVEGGVARLSWFDADAIDAVPGPALRAGLVLEWMASSAVFLRVEPGVAWQVVRFETNSAWEGAVFAEGERFPGEGAWRWWMVELPLLARLLLPGGLDLSLGASAAVVLGADEASGVLGDERARLGDAGRDWGVEGIIGVGHRWAAGDAHLRVDLRAAQGLAGVNTADDPVELLPQRFSLGVEVVF
ncbi:MAG: hypothetical protein R3F65_10280 [bacterium]|nr:hypothetical protein [Myxococcales bacterium]MCB9543182.1 hypothetical protein [Myxococcales bacterium]